jgi:hypothetical protein
MTDVSILQEIERVHGAVTASLVVDAARDPDHPWHDHFEWDNEAAAERWRLTQARQLIRSVKYSRRTETRLIYAPAYVRDPDAAASEQAYISMAMLRTDADRARSVLIAEFSRVASALRRAREIAVALSLEGEVAAMLAQVEGLTAVLRSPAEGPQVPQ